MASDHFRSQITAKKLPQKGKNSGIFLIVLFSLQAHAGGTTPWLRY